MFGWHHQLSGHDFEQVPGDGEGQGSLVCSSPWGHKELDMTEPLNNSKVESHCTVSVCGGYTCDCLISFSIMSSRFMHVIAHGKVYLFKRLNVHS